jgi:hypothetical protein
MYMKSVYQSFVVLQILSALTLANTNIPSFIPNLRKRRAGNAGLDSSKVSLPFALPGQNLDLSEEERNGDEMIPGQAKKFDVVLCGDANEVQLEDGNKSGGEGSDGFVAENEKVGMPNDLNLERYNSRRGVSYTKRKSRGIQMNDSIETHHDKTVSINDGEKAYDCYWKPSSELHYHQSKSVDNNGSLIRTTETTRCRSDYGDFRNRNIPDEEKLYLTEESGDEPPQKINFMPSVDIAGVSDGSTSFCPELSHLAILSSHSGISVGSPHKVITVAPCDQRSSGDRKSVNLCEVGTQTSLSIVCIEMQERNAGHSSTPSLPRACTSQSTQVSPSPSLLSVPPPKPQRHIETSHSPHINMMTGNVSSIAASRGLNYSYNAHQLMKEITELTRLVGPPVRPKQRKSAQGRDIARSKSANGKSIELQCKPVLL